MKITILGAGSCLPVANYSPAGCVVQIRDTVLLLDAGPGTLGRLAAHGLDYRTLDFVLISHLHPDHTLDILTLIQALDSTPGWQRERDLILIGCHGLRSFVSGALELYKDIGPESFALNVMEVADETMHFEGWTLQHALTGHTPNSIALRVEAEGKSLVYTGDAANAEDLIELCTHADLLISECSFPAGFTSPDHLTPIEVGRLASRSKVRRVILTHLYPAAIEADLVGQVQEVFSGQVEKAVDGLVIEV